VRGDQRERKGSSNKYAPFFEQQVVSQKELNDIGDMQGGQKTEEKKRPASEVSEEKRGRIATP